LSGRIGEGASRIGSKRRSLVLVKLALSLVVMVLGCSSSPATKVATARTAFCIAAVAAADLASKKAPQDIVRDAIQQCGADAELVAETLQANRALVQAATPATHAAPAVDVLGALIDAAKAFDGGH
jgi:uncharacterized protein (DUF1800 family)